jgi:hypothetical protein
MRPFARAHWAILAFCSFAGAESEAKISNHEHVTLSPTAKPSFAPTAVPTDKLDYFQLHQKKFMTVTDLVDSDMIKMAEQLRSATKIRDAKTKKGRTIAAQKEATRLKWLSSNWTHIPTAKPSFAPTAVPTHPPTLPTRFPTKAPTLIHQWSASSWWTKSATSKEAISISANTSDSHSDMDWISSTTHTPTAQPTAPTISPTPAPPTPFPTPQSEADRKKDELKALRKRYTEIEQEKLKRKKGVKASDPAYMEAFVRFQMKKKKEEHVLEREMVQARSGFMNHVKTSRFIPTPAPSPAPRNGRSSAMDWVRKIINPIRQKEHAREKAKSVEEQEEQRQHSQISGEAYLNNGKANLDLLRKNWKTAPIRDIPHLRLAHLHLRHRVPNNTTGMTATHLALDDSMARAMHRTYWYLFPETEDDRLPEDSTPTTRPTPEKTYWNLPSNRIEHPVEGRWGEWYLPITAHPTYRPTTAPTGYPSSAPTFPTGTPTHTPTAFPSSMPTTSFPTTSPTAPTANPTPAPSVPTAPPTLYPTASPTISECKQQCGFIFLKLSTSDGPAKVKSELKRQGFADPCSVLRTTPPGPKRDAAHILCACFDHCSLTNSPLLPSLAPTACPSSSPTLAPSLDAVHRIAKEKADAESASVTLELKSAKKGNCRMRSEGALINLGKYGCFALSLTASHAVMNVKFDLKDEDDDHPVEALSNANGWVAKEKLEVQFHGSYHDVEIRASWSKRVPAGTHVLTYLELPEDGVCIKGQLFLNCFELNK